MFEGVEGSGQLGGVKGAGSKTAVRIGDLVSVTLEASATGGAGHVILEWEAGAVADMVADAIVAVILQVS